ncbi:MAG: DUF924 domain-containing protein [Actinomycetota bacterium]|nr:DUF924 domain-containing protein [Actinomycetota bacterium]
MPSEPGEVLDFWFGRENEPVYGEFREAWFQKDEEFDGQIRDRFLEDYERAARGEYDRWKEDAESCLALVILLDQFPRNLFRGDPRTYATDDKALGISREGIEQGLDRKLPPFQRHFLYMPFMHSEDLEDQRRSVTLFRELAEEDGPDVTEYAEGHRDIVERFGRFPHRNEVLGRRTTPEEAEFLEQPGSSF